MLVVEYSAPSVGPIYSGNVIIWQQFFQLEVLWAFTYFEDSKSGIKVEGFLRKSHNYVPREKILAWDSNDFLAELKIYEANALPSALASLANTHIIYQTN